MLPPSTFLRSVIEVHAIPSIRRMAEAEERECRICRGNDEPGRPLLHPCRCSGSIKYTHEDCLVNWLAQSGSTRCELCNHSFRFEPLYQPNTPTALSTKEFVVGILAHTRKAFYTISRILLVSTVWLFCLPVGTCWTWYSLFMDSPSHLPKWIISRGWGGLVLDAFYGFLLSAGIVFVFLGVSSLRDYIRQFPQDALNPEDHNADADADVAQEIQPAIENQPDHYDIDGPDLMGADDQLPLGEQPPHGLDRFHHYHRENIPQQHRHGDNWLQHRRTDDEVLYQVDELVRDTYDDITGVDDSDEDIAEPDGNPGEDSDDNPAPLYMRLPHERNRRHGAVPPPENMYVDSDSSSSEYRNDNQFRDHPFEIDGYEHDSDVEDVDDDVDDEQHVALPGNDEFGVEDQDAREGGALFGLFELDPDEVPLEEVVGLRGHLRNLFDNALTVLFSNAIFLGVFTLVPLLIGRLTLRVFSMQSFPSTLNISSVLTFGMSITKRASSIPSSFVLAYFYVSDLMSQNATFTPAFVSHFFSMTSNFLEWPKSTLSTSSSEIEKSNADLTRHLPSTISTTSMFSSEMPTVSYLDNLLIVLLGYGVIALIAVAYIGIMSTLRHRYPRLDTPFTRQVARMLRYVATFVKIVVLILFEFGIFPLGCGWWLDICTLDILGASLQSRLAYCHDSPWICTGIHWVMGIIYMVQISLFVSLLREVVRPELLWFLRNPDDPEFHPFRELVEKPLSRHARRLIISVVIYMPLVVALVYVPAQICLRVLPGVFPFISEDFSHILIDVPFGNLLLGPLLHPLYIGRQEISVQKIVGAWTKWVSQLLGIADVVLKNENQRGEVGEHGGGDADENGEDEDLNVDDVRGDELDELIPEFEFYDRDDAVRDGYSGDDASSLNGSEGEDGLGRSRRWTQFMGGIMIVAAWATIISFECAMISIPTVIGRKVMGIVGLPVRHDLHPFLLGLNIFLGAVSVCLKAGRYIRTLGPVTIVATGIPYIATGLRGSLILVVGIGVIPLATGLLFELILMPIRVGHNETPYFCVHQDWALGLLLLKVWACIAVTGGLGGVWRERVVRIREWDMAGLDRHFGRLLRELLLPVLIPILTMLSGPYSFARGVLPALGAERWVCNAVYRYSYLAIACGYCSWESMRYVVSWLRDLHDSIRDEKYLVGKRLYNFNESPDG